MITYLLKRFAPRSMSLADIARITHEANRQYCLQLGDFSQRSWPLAPQWQKDSAINGVRFLIENPHAGPSALHDNWVAEKRAAGWVHGAVKDPDATPPTHPCMVPFDRLSPQQKFKDRLFNAIVDAARRGGGPYFPDYPPA